MNDTTKVLTLVGPLQIRMPARPNHRFEVRCHRCPESVTPDVQTEAAG